MTALWRWITLRHLFQEGGRTLLTLLGVALGVAVFVSIRLANYSAMASFAETVDAVAGKANLQVTTDSEGMDERLYPKVRAFPGIQAAAPVVQAYARAAMGPAPHQEVLERGDHGAYGETLLVLGIDVFNERPFARFEAPRSEGTLAALQFLTDPRAIAVTRTLATRNGLGEGDPITILASGKPVTLNVRWIIESQELQQAMGGNVVIMDIAAAQEVFHRYGKLDRIDLLVDPARKDAVKAALQPTLPAHVSVTQPQGRTQQVENMVSAFGLNLTALSFIALFVSMFLIFNSVSMAVLRRRREIGILRSLGVTRAQVVRQFLTEALFLGFVGSVLGLALGTLIARGTLGAISQTLSVLYLVVQAQRLYLDPAVYVLGFGLGVGMSLLSALAPALEAAATPPSLTTRQGMLIEAQPLPIGRFTAAGIGALVLAAGVSYWTVAAHRPFGGFISAFLVVTGFSLISPGFTLLSERMLTPLMGRIAGIEGLLGLRYLREAVARTSVVVAALMVAVGMLVGLTIMVGSFRQTVSIWVNQTLRGDLYVEPVGRDVAGNVTTLPAEVEQVARGLPGVEAVDTYRGVQITYNNAITGIAGIDFAVQAKYGRLQFIGADADRALNDAIQHDGVIATESFAFKHRVKAGDRLRLETPSGVVALPISGVFYDYSTDGGYLMMDYHLFQRLWKDHRTERVAMYLKPGTDPVETRSRFIRSLRSGVVLYVTPNQSLRSRVLTIFDQTFRITYALQGISILVAVLGVISTLTALILQRSREIGVLRAVGALRGQVRKMVLVESGLLGLIGGALGCVCGLALAYLLTYVINKQFFGWSIRMTIDPWVFVQAVALMVVTALFAGVGPARLAASRLAAEAMRVE